VLAAREGAGDCLVLVGSGLDPGNARELLRVADGAIVGTSLMSDGRATSQRVADLAAVRA
jgi:predicted TIM-barrel enzyme